MRLIEDKVIDFFCLADKSRRKYEKNCCKKRFLHSKFPQEKIPSQGSQYYVIALSGAQEPEASSKELCKSKFRLVVFLKHCNARQIIAI